MNALYCCCVLDPWIDVAKILIDKFNIEPVYWIGWNENNESNQCHEFFPNIIYHDISDAWKGIFPDNVEINNSNIDLIDILEQNFFHELVTIKMIDRLDPDQRSFNFTERQRFYRSLLEKWYKIIDNYKIDLIIAPAIPHRVFDYVIYIISKYLKLKFMTIIMTSIPDLILITEDVYHLPPKLITRYNSLISKNDRIYLTNNIRKYLTNLKNEYKHAEPEYMKRLRDTIVLKRKFPPIYLIPIRIINRFINNHKLVKTYIKDKKKSLEESSFTIKQMKNIKKDGIKYKIFLKNYYEDICIQYNKNIDYAFVALHYQPEETSCPLGGIFADQLIIVKLLKKIIPSNWTIYIKEHVSQFHPELEGETGRDIHFYNELKKIRGVQFISTNVNPFEVIDNARFVATITGTIGWEAINRNKPVLVFGNAWYKHCNGAFIIQNEEDIIEAVNKIVKGFSVNDELVEKYVQACVEVGQFAYHYKGLKESSGITHDESVKALVDGLAEYFV